MKNLLLIAFFLYSSISLGQSPEAKDSVLPFNKNLLNGSNTKQSNSFQLQTPTLYNFHDSLGLIDFQPTNKTVNFPERNKYTLAPRLNLDGNLYNQYKINNRNWINTMRIQSNFIGLGGMTLYGANYNWKIGDYIIVSSGLYATKYNIYNNFRSDAGVNGNIKFVLSDRISMNLFGQYSPNGMKNTVIPLMAPLYPQSYYGGSLEYKVNDKWGLMVGADREFDVVARKWIIKPFVMPLFYFK